MSRRAETKELTGDQTDVWAAADALRLPGIDLSRQSTCQTESSVKGVKLMNLKNREPWFRFFGTVLLIVFLPMLAAAMQMIPGQVGQPSADQGSNLAAPPVSPVVVPVPDLIKKIIFSPLTPEQIMSLPEPARSMILQSLGWTAAPASSSSSSSVALSSGRGASGMSLPPDADAPEFETKAAQDPSLSKMRRWFFAFAAFRLL
jgi:hypothetical protein